MTKRILALLLCLALCLSLIPAAFAEDIEITDEEETLDEIALVEPEEIALVEPETVSALPAEPNEETVDSGSCGDELNWMLYDDGRLVIAGSGAMTDYTRGTAPWYKYHETIHTLCLECDESTIGNYAFFGCANLKLADASFPEDMTRIGDCAFLSCNALTYICLPESVTEVGAQAFCYCNGLKHLTVCGAPTLGYKAFGDCPALEEVSFLGEGPTFHDGTFTGDNELYAYYPPATNNWTDKRKKYGASSVTWKMEYHGWCGEDVYWWINPDYNQTGAMFLAGEGPTWDYPNVYPSFYAFRDKFIVVRMYDYVTTVGSWLFYNLNKVQVFTLSKQLTEIGEMGFAFCTSASTISLPSTFERLGKNAFYDCELYSISFYCDAPVIEQNAFNTLTCSVYYCPLPGWTDEVCQNYGGTITWVCDNQLGADVYWKVDADNVMTVYGSGETYNYYTYSSTPIYTKCNRTQWKKLVIEEGVTDLGPYLFPYMYFEQAVFPAGLMYISSYLFYNTNTLTRMIFQGAAPTIFSQAFEGITATAYYSSYEPSWTSDVMQDYGGSITWVPFEMPVYLTEQTLTLPVHDSHSLSAHYIYGAPEDLVWSSSNETVATVDETGAVTAHKYGKCIIRAATEDGNYFAECEVQTLFWDVADSSKYYFRHVYWAAEKGITKGYNLEYFAPQEECTREQMMTFLWRLADKPNPKTTSSPFPDVKSGDYFYKAVLWGVEKKITAGYSEGPYAGKFGVGLPCTREQAMTFLWRMAGKPDPGTTTNPFSDIRSTDYFYKAVLWAAKNGIANGYADGTYGYGVPCLREHMVTFLSRYASKFM